MGCGLAHEAMPGQPFPPSPSTKWRVNQRTPPLLRSTPAAVVVDFDDTLVDTGRRFDNRRRALFAFLEEAGFPRREVESVHHDVVDQELLGIFGYGPFRLGPSFRDTYLRLAHRHGQDPDPALAREAEARAAGIDEPPPPLPGAMEALEALSSRLPVALWTQSHFPDYQRRCVEAAGVLDILRADQVFVTPEKDASRFSALLGNLGVAPASRSVMVGNSMRKDVNPALEAGARAIWIDAGPAWHMDRAEPVGTGFLRVRSFPEAVERILEHTPSGEASSPLGSGGHNIPGAARAAARDRASASPNSPEPELRRD